MNKTSSEYLIYYDKEIIKMISEKYNVSALEAFKMFVNSKTYKMLENKDLEMYEFGAPAIFDMWKNEKMTGRPQNSIYLRSID